MDVERIPAPEIRDKVLKKTALLVCAYESEEKFKTYPLEGAISLAEFKSRLGEVDKGQEIFFYCN